jgi:hypothetical protein
MGRDSKLQYLKIKVLFKVSNSSSKLNYHQGTKASILSIRMMADAPLPGIELMPGYCLAVDSLIRAASGDAGVHCRI